MAALGMGSRDTTKMLVTHLKKGFGCFRSYWQTAQRMMDHQRSFVSTVMLLFYIVDRLPAQLIDLVPTLQDQFDGIVKASLAFAYEYRVGYRSFPMLIIESGCSLIIYLYSSAVNVTE